MPAKGWSKYTPEQLTRLSELYKTMPLRDAAIEIGIPYNAAFYQLQKRGLLSKPFSSIVKSHPVTLTDAQLHYLAGLVDGEGTVTIRKLHRGKSRKPAWKPCVIVSNTDRRLMDWLLSAIPTSSAYVDSRKTPSGSTSYRFWAIGLGYLPLFEALQPVLVLKGDLMELVVEWTRERLSQSRTDPLTPRQLEIVSLIRGRNMTPSQRLANGTYGTFLSSTSPPLQAPTE